MTLLISGCGGEPEPPPPPPEALLPPEPTKQEVFAQFREALSPLFTTVAQPSGDVGEAQKSQAITKLQSLKAKHTTSENGPAAIKEIQAEVEDMITKMRDAQRWATLKTCVDFFKIFEPGSDKYLSYVEKADLMMARPIVSVKGFFELTDGLYAFLEVEDKVSKESKSYKVREGEEFHEGILRLVRIIGNKQSVEVEYTPINTTWIVKGPGS
jgi:hypothetical protein